MKGKNKKAYWERERKKKALLVEKEAQEELKAAAERKKRRKQFRPVFRELEIKPGPHDVTMAQDRSRNLPSKTTLAAPVKYERQELTPELQEREDRARKETDRKRKMLAPLYNKGPVQYLGDAPDDIIKNLGKKV